MIATTPSFLAAAKICSQDGGVCAVAVPETSNVKSNSARELFALRYRPRNSPQNSRAALPRSPLPLPSTIRRACLSKAGFKVAQEIFPLSKLWQGGFDGNLCHLSYPEGYVH